MFSKCIKKSKINVLINANNFIFTSEIRRSKLIICSSSTVAIETYYYKKIIFEICTVDNQEKIFEAFQKNLDYKGINFCNEISLLKFMINFNNYKKKLPIKASLEPLLLIKKSEMKSIINHYLTFYRKKKRLKL